MVPKVSFILRLVLLYNIPVQYTSEELYLYISDKTQLCVGHYSDNNDVVNYT